MSSGDWAMLFGGIVVIALAVIAAAVYFIRSDYRMTLSATIAKRNPPKPPAPKPAEQANVTDITGRAAS